MFKGGRGIARKRGAEGQGVIGPSVNGKNVERSPPLILSRESCVGVASLTVPDILLIGTA